MHRLIVALVAVLMAVSVSGQEFLVDEAGQPILNEHGHRIDAENNAYDEHGKRVTYTRDAEEAGYFVALRKPPQPVPDSEPVDKCDPCGDRAREVAADKAAIVDIEGRLAEKRKTLEEMEKWMLEANVARQKLDEQRKRTEDGIEGFRAELAQLVAEKEGIVRGLTVDQLTHQVARAKEALAKLRGTGSSVHSKSGDAENAKTVLKTRIADLQKRIHEMEPAQPAATEEV